MITPARLTVATLIAAACLVAGCTHSSLYVESDPAGAMVYFDGKPQGKTPVEFEFDWYGGHRIRLRKEGCRDLEVIEEIRAPLHYQVPFDLITTLIPAKIQDRQYFFYTLIPSATEAQEPSGS